MKTFWVGGWRVEPALNRIEREEESRHLEPRAMDVLVYLAEHAGDVVSKDRLIRALWPDSIVTDGAVTYSINQIRHLLGDDARQPRFIETIPRRGYRLIAEVAFAIPAREEPHYQALEQSGAGRTGVVHPDGETSPNRRVVLEFLRRETAEEEPWPRNRAHTGPEAISRKAARWPVWATFLAVVVILALLTGALLWRSDGSLDPSESARLTVTPFTVEGGVKRFPSFSPDGERIAFGWDGPDRENWDIYVKGLGKGAAPLRLTFHPAEDRSPAWSPDGRLIAFTRLFAGGGASIYLVPSLGGPERKLIDRKGNLLLAANDPLYRVSWSPAPDADTLVYSEVEAAGGPARIVRLSMKTLEKKVLTHPPEDSRGDFAAEFSPDGRQIAFLREGSRIGMKIDVWVQDIEGGVARRVTGLAAAAATRPIWTSDGRAIVYSAWQTGSLPQVWRVEVETGRNHAVAGPGQGAGELDIWGDRLVFEQSTAASTDIRRVLVGADPGSESERLIGSFAGEGNPDISPDGTEIVFESNRDGPTSIWKCRSDGSNPVRMTFFEEWCGTPRWAPDGRRIVFDSQHSGNWDLWLLDADGGIPRQLTAEPSEENQGTWSRDGRWIYFSSTRTGSRQLFKVRSDGGEAIRLTRGGGVFGLESRDGQYLYYTKASAFGLWRMETGGQRREEQVLPDVRFRNFAVGSKGIYFATFSHLDFRIFLLDPGTGKSTELHHRHGPLLHNDLTVSPDEKWILYGEGPQESELMLVEHFR